MPFTFYQLSTINYQLSTINYQLSIINYQLSIINYQLSIINYQLSIIKIMSRFTWLLDNGHGGVSNGKYLTDGKQSPVWDDGSVLYEGEFNRAVVNRLAEMLTAAKINYVKIAPQDIDTLLQERCVRVLRWTKEYPCIFLSIHANYGDGKGTAKGWEVWTTKGQSQSDKVASVFYGVFKADIKNVTMRGDWEDGDCDREEDFYVLKNTSCPAILTENFFMDNLYECNNYLMSSAGRNWIAQKHFEAIVKIEAEGIN